MHKCILYTLLLYKLGNHIKVEGTSSKETINVYL